MVDHYDVIVVGSGAGGGTFAHRLAPTGKRVLLLERGDYLPRERDNWDSDRGLREGQVPRAASSGSTATATSSRPRSTTTSAGTPSSTARRCSGCARRTSGRSATTAGSRPAWPLGYDDLEPYYTQAEHLYQVHGRHGEDPTGGPASADYAHPPVQHEERIQQLSDDLEKEGLHPFHLPIGVRLTQDEHGRATHDSVCIRCDRVDGFPCLVGGKSDAQVICVDPALAQHENLHLVTNAHVRELETDPSGRTVTAVVADVGGETVRVHRRHRRAGLRRGEHGRAAAALGRRPAPGRPRELLRCRGPALHAAQQPGDDGRVARTRTRTVFQKTLAFNDWYLGSDDWDYPLGGVQMLGKSDAEQVRANAPGWAGSLLARDAVRGAGPPRRRLLAVQRGPARHRRTGSPSTATAGSTSPSTRRTTSRGSPGCGTTCRTGSAHWACSEKHLLHHSIYMHKGMPIGATAHQAGTVRFGTDPSSSALDVHCKAHDVDNLYVVDTSFFPSIGAVNPSLTAIANALRVGDHVIERLG